MERRQNWVATATGSVFDFERKDNPIEILDISIPLSKASRYTGATVGNYPVATHTVSLARWLRFAPIKPTANRSERAQATLEAFRALAPHEQRSVLRQVVAHDMPEAFVCDVARPVKRYLEPAYSEMESIAYASIANRWPFLPASMKDFHEIVWQVDNFVLVDEIQQILFLPTLLRSVSGVERPIAGQGAYQYDFETMGGPLGIIIRSQDHRVADISFRRAARSAGFD